MVSPSHRRRIDSIMKHYFLLLLCTGASLAQTAGDFRTGQAARAVIGQPTFTAQSPISSDTVLGGVAGIAFANNTLVVADSESSYANFRPSELGVPGPEVRAVPRNAGWQPGIRIGSAKDGSLRYFIAATRPEGMGADDQGNIFGGLTAQCSASGADRPTPGGPNCLQKWAKK